jgi:hypothetical protein
MANTALIVGGVAVVGVGGAFLLLRRKKAPSAPPTTVKQDGSFATLCQQVVATGAAGATKTNSPIGAGVGIAAAVTAPLLCKGAKWAAQSAVKAATTVAKHTGPVAKVYAEGYAKAALAPALISYKVIVHPITTAKLAVNDTKLLGKTAFSLAKKAPGAVFHPTRTAKASVTTVKQIGKSPVKSAKKVLSTGSKLLGGFHF